jgi:hypothetical protein
VHGHQIELAGRNAGDFLTAVQCNSNSHGARSVDACMHALLIDAGSEMSTTY